MREHLDKVCSEQRHSILRSPSNTVPIHRFCAMDIRSLHEVLPSCRARQYGLYVLPTRQWHHYTSPSQ